MSFFPSSNLVFANRSIPAGNTLKNTTSKSYFNSKITVPANYSTPDMVWVINAYGYYSTSTLVLCTTTMRIEANRNVMLASSSAMAPALSISKEYWFLQATLSVQTLGATGSIIANGFVGASLANSGTLSVQPMITTNPVTGINYTVATDLEISVQMSVANNNNSWTLENCVWEEKRLRS